MGERILVKGQNVPLDPEASSLRLSVRWSSSSNPVDVDLVTLILGADRRVRTDADMIFYNQTATADGSVVHAGKVTAESGGSDDVLVDLTAVDANVHALTVAASTDGSPFSEVDHLEWLVAGEQAEPVARFPVTGLTSERALVLGEVYRRDGQWRLRAVGQGWDGGLAGLASDYGVTVDGSEAPVETDGELTESSADATAPVLTSGSGIVDRPDDAAPIPAGSEPERVVAETKPAPARGPRKVRVAVDKPVSLPPIRLAEDPAWQSSRLFSISGIGGADEQEKRATSALLWTMAAVRPLAAHSRRERVPRSARWGPSSRSDSRWVSNASSPTG